MNINDIDIYNMPLWMGEIVDEINNHCEVLLRESEQYKRIVDESHYLMETYNFISTLIDRDEIKELLKLSLEETKALSRFLSLDDDRRYMEVLQTYLMGCRHVISILQLIKVL